MVIPEAFLGAFSLAISWVLSEYESIEATTVSIAIMFNSLSNKVGRYAAV